MSGVSAKIALYKYSSFPVLSFNQPLRSTQPGHPSVGRHNEYQPKGGDVQRLGSKSLCVDGR